MHYYDYPFLLHILTIVGKLDDISVVAALCRQNTT